MHLNHHISVFPIPNFNDNYIWLLVNNKNNTAVAVDPGKAKPILNILQKQKLELCAILVTHHHTDHTGGITELLRHYPKVTVYQKSNCSYKDTINIPDCDLTFSVIETPGHTQDHISFLSEKMLFCGDTLFAGGCGRLFEGTAQQLFDSLSKLSKLPKNTQVYCAHEYTLSNLRFALTVEPSNLDVQARFATIQELRHNSRVTLPSTMEIELLTNPFLRTSKATVWLAVERFFDIKIKTEPEVFAMLRKWKDEFI